MPGLVLAVAYGNLAQWISAVVATVAVLAAGALLLHGRRTDADVKAQSLDIDGQLFLDVRIGIRPVGSLASHPYEPLTCARCAPFRPHGLSVEVFEDDSWLTSKRCNLEDVAVWYRSRDVRWPTLLRRKSAMEGRRAKWGCVNRKISRIEIFEVLPALNDDGEAILEQVLVRTVMNALRSQFAEPHERAEAAHIIPVDAPGLTAIGWRVVFTVQIPKELWFFNRPNKDSWRWIVDDFVPVPRREPQPNEATADPSDGDERR